MKKLFLILLSILIIVGGLGYLAYKNAAPLLAKIISNKTQTPVTIHAIDFYKESFTITEIQIGNPHKAQLPTALKVQTVNVEAPYKNYIEDPILIDKIELNNVYVNIQIYNKDQTEGNWQTLMKNLSEDHRSPLSVERITVIKKLILTNIQIDLILSDGKYYRLSPMERLEFNNIRSDKGIPTQEISEIIIQQMMQQIFLQKGLKAIIDAPVDIIKGVIPFL